jgi:hypothetical protein
MNREQRILLGAVIFIVVAFLAGFGWQYTKARGLAADLSASSEELTFKRLEATLAAATIEAYRGNYEIARQLASSFFTSLQNDLQEAPEDKQMQLRAIMNQRDAIITAASRSDPQTASLLGQLYSTYRVAFGEAPVQAPPAAAAPAPPATTTQ